MSPIVEFSETDFLRSKILTPAWYRVRVDAVGEKLSKDTKSTNYPVEATVLFNAENGSKEFEGVPLDENNWMFNSKRLDFAINFLLALGHVPKPGGRVELNAAAGKEVDVFIGNSTWEGRTKNQVTHQYRLPVPAEKAPA